VSRAAEARFRERVVAIARWWAGVRKFLSDSAWYFYLFWLPKYLYDARGFDVRHVSTLADSVCGFPRVEFLGGVFEPLDADGAFAELSRASCAGLSSALMPAVMLVPRVRFVCDVCVQRGFLRAAVVSGFDYDGARTFFRCARWDSGGGTDRVWRRVAGDVRSGFRGRIAETRRG